MSIIIKSGAGSDLATVNTNKQLLVNTGTTATAGFSILAGEVDSGSVTGTALRRNIVATNNLALKTTSDKLVFNDSFTGTTLNNSNWLAYTSAATIAVTGGFLDLNSSANTGALAVGMVTSQASFPVRGNSTIGFQCNLKHTNKTMADKTMEVGLFLATTFAAPTDGVGFRWTSTGTLVGFLNNGGTEVTTAAITPKADAEVHQYRIVLSDKQAEFYIDDVLVATPLANGLAANHIIKGMGLPICLRYNNVGVPAAAADLYVSDTQVFIFDADISYVPALMAVQSGGMALNPQNGMTVAPLMNYANSAAPGSATLSNIAAGYTTLGGQWRFAAVSGAETDYALFGFLVPAVSTTTAGKRLYITDCSIDSINTVVAVATTATVFQWSLAVGSTGVSLATTDSDTGKRPRIACLGLQSFAIGAAVGAQAANSIVRNFTTPLVANPGEYVHIILKIILGTNTATEIWRGTCYIGGYWE